MDISQRCYSSTLDVEEAIIGGLILSISSITLDQLTELDPQYFSSKKYRLIYNAIKSMMQNNQGIDLITLKYYLADEPECQYEISEVDLYELVNNSIGLQNLEQYIDILVKGYEYRMHELESKLGLKPKEQE